MRAEIRAEKKTGMIFMNLIRYDRWGTDFVRNLQKLILRWYLQAEAYEISIHSFFAERV